MRRRVLLVDGNDDFLDGLCSLLEKEPGLEVVGRAHSGQEAIDRVSDLAPDLVLMDVLLPDMTGFQAATLLKAGTPSLLVVMLTFHFSRIVTQAALLAGAECCVCKTDVPDRLLNTVQQLLWPAGVCQHGGE